MIRKIKNKVREILIIVILTVMVNAHARNVNVLTWWGYLDSQWISSEVKKRCDVKLSYDSYNSNPEMIRRWRQARGKYDILIFSNAVYNVIRDEISMNDSDLYKNAEKYNPNIRRHYLKSNYAPNIAYFQHTFTGFIWNPRLINLNETETISSSFEKAKTHMVVIMDDPVEMSMVYRLSSNSKSESDELSVDNFKDTVKSSRVFVSNQLNQVYDSEEFAFAYQWSGIGIAEIKLRKGYRFLVNENLSYVSTDMIAQVTANKYSSCVSNFLSSKEFLSKLQEESYYFSPYGDYENINDNQFKEIYRVFINKLPKLKWVEPPSARKFAEKTYKWDMIKYEISK